ncbi:MAG TPA: prepilin peptidase [Candidatus Saccharimonadales bacterium]|nr:prepilin peptidase [Candidatus Saccharimonadales bacterium]
MLIYLWLVIAGLCFGSFTNAFVWRLHEQEEQNSRKSKVGKSKVGKSKASKTTKSASGSSKDLSILKGRSMCTHCGHQLAALDLVPVFSWVFLRGKCRYCHQKIDDWPIVELLMPILFAFSYAMWPLAMYGWGAVEFWVWLVFLVGFMILAVYDLRWYILPDRVVYPLMGLAAINVLVHVLFFHGGTSALLGACWGVLISSGIFYVLFQLSQGKWIGGGDVKLGVVIGLLIGGPLNSFLLLFIASTLGSIVSIPLLIVGKAKRTTLIPFGPFLLLATFIIVIYGTAITDWLYRVLLLK